METDSGKWFYSAFGNNVWIGEGSTGKGKGYYLATFPDGVEGSWRLLAINSQIAADSASDQYEWLMDLLDDASERCILAFWHAPVFSSGYHGHDESEDYAEAEPARQGKLAPVFDLLYRAHASIVLNGHDHHFEHLALHDFGRQGNR